MLVSEALDVYRAKVSMLKRGYAQEYYRIEQLKKHPLAEKKLSNVSSVDIAKYRDDRLVSLNEKTGAPISSNTVRLELSLLSNLFDVATIEWGEANGNPVKLVRKPKISQGRERRLLAREEKLILRYAANFKNKQLYTIIVLALETAMRQGEILGLKWENVNFKTRIAHLPMTKNGRKRDVPLSLKAKQGLMAFEPKTSGDIFSYTASGFKSTWRYMLKKLDINDLHFHDLRHEAISRLVELGTMDVLEIAEITGHRSLAMLQRYTHLKATRLVKLLDGRRKKGQQVLLDAIVPYPVAIKECSTTGVQIQLLDFGLTVVDQDRQVALKLAKGELLRLIFEALKNGQQPPEPDSYIDIQPVTGSEILMIDPV